MGIVRLFEHGGLDALKTVAMFAIAFLLVYLAIVKQYEPLLLLPIAIGMLLTNLPGAEIFHLNFFIDPAGVNFGQVLREGGLLDILYLGVKLGIYPSLIFIGIGAMTDFNPLISNPKSLLIGAGAQ
ncbi:MAG: sodium ion-translocating decarboxylase subunit beta, partial [Clostridia bacterium]|nr:sodium ion-translocating decarboxylase subunit beta [Clostridia bacterium]